MKTWQKVLATLGVAVAVVIIDVIRKESGIVLGGLPYMLFYGVLLCVPIALIWKSKTKTDSEAPAADDSDEKALARQILQEREEERKRKEEEAEKARQEDDKKAKEERLRSLSDEELSRIISAEKKEPEAEEKATGSEDEGAAYWRRLALILILSVMFICVILFAASAR